MRFPPAKRTADPDYGGVPDREGRAGPREPSGAPPAVDADPPDDAEASDQTRDQDEDEADPREDRSAAGKQANENRYRQVNGGQAEENRAIASVSRGVTSSLPASLSQRRPRFLSECRLRLS